jgi:hypothetical protein
LKQSYYSTHYYFRLLLSKQINPGGRASKKSEEDVVA